jgi:hypothetical protein
MEMASGTRECPEEAPTRAYTNDPVMAYFDPLKPTTVIVDASPSGLGALV